MNILNPFGISDGTKKRVGLTRAIVYQSEYILYNEPTTDLDPIMSDVNDLINKFEKYLHVTSTVVTCKYEFGI
ncbi:MAG: hypothetical protein LBD56_00125 [Endomicrobium sp.]|nr:hypothetical protein [Endomicrobium sp.]